MRRRELVLIGIIILLVGVIAGLGLGALSDDETTGAGSDVATSADTNPSEQQAESEDTAHASVHGSQASPSEEYETLDGHRQSLRQRD